MKLPKPEFPLRTTLLYLLFGGLWILLSDQLLSLLPIQSAQQTVFQTIKGLFFILVSGTLLYILLRRDFATRGQAEDAMRESEERFRLMFEKNPSIMMLIEPVSGTIKDVNQSAVTFYGYSLAELRGMNIGTINQLSPEQVQAERMRALHEERNFFNFPHRLSNGDIRLVEVHSAPIKLGEETLLFSIIHDATERRKAQQELQDIQNRMGGIVESAMDAIISTDRNQMIVLANPAAEKMFAYDEGQLIGKPLDLLLPERYRQIHSEQIRQFGMTGITTRSMHSLGAVYGLRRGGEEFPTEASISQILIGSEKIYTVILRDITERQKAERALHLEVQRFQRFVDSNIIGIVIADATGKISMANDYYLRILGVTRQDFLNERVDWRDFTPPEWLPADENAIRELRDHGVCEPYEKEYQRADGTRVSVYIADAMLPGPGDQMAAFVLDLTELKLAEEAVRQSQKRFRALIEHAPDGIALLGLDGRLRQVTPSAEWILGYANQDAVGQDPALLTHPDDLPALSELLNDLMQNPGKTVHAEYRFKHKNGSWRWLHSAITNLTTEPSVNAVVFNYRDVTEQKQAEERIQRQLQRLHALHKIDAAISNSFAMQISLGVLLKETCAQLSIDAASILLLRPETRTLEYVAGNGFNSSVIEDTRIDIGDGEAGRAALERSHVYIEDLSQPDSSFSRREVVQSEEFVSYFVTPLVTKGEVKGVLELYHRSVIQTNSEWLDFMETLAGQAALAIENAQLFESLHRSNIELEQRVLERTMELNRINAELGRANRAKDEFLATMSHELRTPLNSVLGLSESLLEERRGPLNAHQQNSLRIIESSGRHLLELINDILDLSKIEAGKLDLYLEPIAVDEFCSSCMAFVRSQALDKSIRLTYTNDAHITRMLADPRRLKQIIVNLLTNAVKFTPDYGEIHLNVTGDPEKELIQFIVKDTGIGIAPQDLRRLFQPFVQLDSNLNRQYQGTGLGLALVQKLTDLHGGSVHVESEVGKGSCFTINLSCKVIDQTEPEPRQIEAIVAVHEEEKFKVSNKLGIILLAEDNESNVMMFSEYIAVHGYDVVVAYNGMEAIEKAGSIQPDLILMDIQMPVLNGLDAIARLRADSRFFSTPIIALTALAMSGDRERCIAAGANEYMSKPIRLRQLMEIINSLLHDE